MNKRYTGLLLRWQSSFRMNKGNKMNEITINNAGLMLKTGTPEERKAASKILNECKNVKPLIQRCTCGTKAVLKKIDDVFCYICKNTFCENHGIVLLENDKENAVKNWNDLITKGYIEIRRDN